MDVSISKVNTCNVTSTKIITLRTKHVNSRQYTCFFLELATYLYECKYSNFVMFVFVCILIHKEFIKVIDTE